MTQPRVGAIVLAAGASRRLGKAKQLLRWDDRSLIQRSVAVAGASMCDRVVVVLGANATRITPEIQDLPIEIIQNSGWESGMSSSLKLGISALSNSVDAVIVMLCDQPLITTSTIDQLIQTYRNPQYWGDQSQSPQYWGLGGQPDLTHPIGLPQSPIVACQYDEVIGVPALFDRFIWPALQALEGDTGARKIIQQYRDRVTTINCPEAAIDIDTPEAWENFLKSKQSPPETF